MFRQQPTCVCRATTSRDSCVFFFFNDTATTEIYTLSLHDALPICPSVLVPPEDDTIACRCEEVSVGRVRRAVDRKSTRLNSSHSQISYAVFCLKKKIYC